MTSQSASDRIGAARFHAALQVDAVQFVDGCPSIEAKQVMEKYNG